MMCLLLVGFGFVGVFVVVLGVFCLGFLGIFFGFLVGFCLVCFLGFLFDF